MKLLNSNLIWLYNMYMNHTKMSTLYECFFDTYITLQITTQALCYFEVD